MNFSKNLKTLFEFTSGEKRGVIVLLLIMLIILALRVYLPVLLPIGNSNFLKYKQISLNTVDSSFKIESSYTNLNNEEADIKILDINKADKLELTQAGFSNFAASNIIKYREKGGKLYSKADLVRIYGIDTMLINVIEKRTNFIYAPADDSYVLNSNSDKKFSIELNSADTSNLMKLNGIGSVLSSRIVKYRKSLGGFFSTNQLLEVYGINNDLYLKIFPKIRTDSTLIDKIDINSVDEKILSLHPYISNYQAKAVIKYRELKGQIENLDELTNNQIFTSEEFIKVKNYLSVR